MTPEEKARENIDTLLVQAGWKIQNVKDVNFDYVPFSQQGGLGTRPKSVPFFIRDSKAQGFAIKVNPSGSIKYIVEICHNGKPVRKTLGAYPIVELQCRSITLTRIVLTI